MNIIVIPARSGSVRIRNKNTVLIKKKTFNQNYFRQN